MARSPSRSSDGGGSQHNVRAEPRLLKAIEAGEKDNVVAIVEEARAKSQPIEHLLRIGLMRAAERGNASIAEYLLKSGAKPDGAPGGRVSPLLRAIDRNYGSIVWLLLQYGGNQDVADKQGRTALMTAAWKNHFQILEKLLQKGADVNKKDNKGRNVLHNLAADKHCNWGKDVIDLLLKQNIAIDGPEGQDNSKRTPLHWAASTGKKELCEMLLNRPKLPRANVNAVEMKDKTPLHLAVAHGRDDIVELLIRHGANARARSDGGWTPLHNACQQGSVKIVRMLLAAGADVNARLLNGQTPLHEAANCGHLDVVKCLLERKDCKRAARDTFGTTPFIRAAQKRNKDIVNILAPFNHVDTLSEDALGACNGFNATIVDFGNFHNNNRVTKRTVFELLYGRDPVNPRTPAFNVIPKKDKAVEYRWIHLPANNMAWVEALLTKAFVEDGAADVAGFMALERSFSHQHRGQQVHSHFMRPLSQSTPRAPKIHDDSEYSDSGEPGAPQIVVSHGTELGIDTNTTLGSLSNSGTGLGIDAMSGAQESSHLPRTPVRTGTISTDQTDWTVGSGSGKEHKTQGKAKNKPKKVAKWSGSRQAGGRSGGTDTPTRQTDHHSRRHSSTTQLASSGHLRSPGSPGRKDPTSVAKGNIFTFMPYLHFESDRGRRAMQEAIGRIQSSKKPGERTHKSKPGKVTTYDEMLLRAHLTSSTVSLHVRRTLDQFFYHNIDTKIRDQDQVVYRYQCKGMSPDELGIDPKIFMVDQLWMWVLGKDLVVTAFPQRWQQPRNDPLNVLDGIIEDINSNTREHPVRNVYDLAIIITGRCSGVFDRHRIGDEEYQFLDMFESSIGDATEMETVLFEEFNSASAQASQWLQHHRRSKRFSRQLEADNRHLEHKSRRSTRPHLRRHILDGRSSEENMEHDDHLGPAHSPEFVDKLLDIGKETDLLAETKDIRDELNMIAKVLEDQRSVLPDLEASIKDIYREEHRSQQELKRRFEEQLKTINIHLKDLERMDKQAERIYKSITDLLDLKQKHANAFEARFARDQAAGTARQSQTIMVFTIVTIIFLPLSFIAAIFTINVREFPHSDGQPSLPFSFVSKWMFGIGFAISIPLIAIALSLDAIGDSFREVKGYFANRKKKMAPARTDTLDEKWDDGFSVDYDAFEQVLSTGRSTSRVRRSIESYFGGGGLLPVTSRGTGRTAVSPVKKDFVVTNGGMGGRRDSSARRPAPVERLSTGFRMRRSEDVERGV